MSRKTLFLHAGLPKTGSSFIQSVLLKNASVLLEKDILFPGVFHNPQTGNSEYCVDANFEINGCLLTNLMKKTAGQPVAEISEKVVSLLAPLFDMDTSKVLLSDETLGVFSDLTWQVLKQASQLLDINLQVFCYFREPSTYYPSYWSQIVRRHGEKRGLLEFAESEHIQVWEKLLHIVDVIPGTLCLGYEAEKERGTLLFSVAAILGIDAEILKTDSLNVLVNPSLSIHALTAIRMLNTEYGETAGIMLDDMLSDLKPIDVASKTILPETHIKLVRERHGNEMFRCLSLYEEAKEVLTLS